MSGWLSLAGLLAVAATVPATSQAVPLTFGAKKFVDHGLGGGEPLMFADNMHGTIIYTSHEGTTHLYRNGVATTVPDWFANYRNQVNEWYSEDDGKTFKRVNWNGTGFFQNPAQNTGFSDPDLTQDEGGRVYNTGINLVNDALFSTIDGGRNWDLGTIQCHEGDRPWLAGGKPNEVFLATNASNGGHMIMQSTDGGSSCGASFKSPGGNGKLYYDKKMADGKGGLVEPNTSMGLNTWNRGDAAFTKQPGRATKEGILSHWPAIALDDASTVYMVWDTDPRARLRVLLQRHRGRQRPLGGTAGQPDQVRLHQGPRRDLVGTGDDHGAEERSRLLALDRGGRQGQDQRRLVPERQPGRPRLRGARRSACTRRTSGRRTRPRRSSTTPWSPTTRSTPAGYARAGRPAWPRARTAGSATSSPTPSTRTAA